MTTSTTPSQVKATKKAMPVPKDVKDSDSEGLSMRQFYKAFAMMGCLASNRIPYGQSGEIVKFSAELADAQVKEDESII